MMIYVADEDKDTLWLGKVDGVDFDQGLISVHRYSQLKKSKYAPLYEDPSDNKYTACARPKKDYKPVIDYVIAREIKAKNFELIHGGAIPKDILLSTNFVKRWAK